MSNFAALVKVRCVALFNSIFGRKLKKRNIFIAALIAIFAVYIIACLFLSFGMMFSKMASSLISAGADSLYFAIAGIIIFAFCIFVGAFSAKAQLFDASDNDLLLSMPILPSVILLSRFAFLMIFKYIYALFIAIPAFVVYLLHASMSPAQIIIFIIGFLLLPMLALSVSCLIAWIMALFSSKTAGKGTIQSVFSVAVMLIFLYFYYNIQAITANILQNYLYASKIIKSFFAPMYSFGAAVINLDLIQILIFALWCIIPLIAVYNLISCGFVKKCSDQYCFAVSKHANTKIDFSSSSVRSALIKLELKRIFSIPIYFLNTCSGAFVNIFMAAAFITKANVMLADPQIASALPIFLCAGISLGAAMTCSTSCSISIEGKSFHIIKALPIDLYDILRSKIIANLIIGTPPIFIAALAAYIAIPMGVNWLIFLILLPFLTLLLISIVGIIANLLAPRFDWISEVEVVKRSASVFITVIFSLVLIFLASILYFTVFYFIPPLSYLQGCALIELLLSIIGTRWLLTFGASRFKKI